MVWHRSWVDIMRRSDWKAVYDAQGGPQAIQNTMHWVQGYILALEDVSKDLDRDLYDYLNDPDAQRALEGALRNVQESLGSAQRTLEEINKILKDPDA